MKTKLMICVLFLGAFFSLHAVGQTLEEPFNYEVGNLNGKGSADGGWGSAWKMNTGLIEVVEGNIGTDPFGKSIQTLAGADNANYTRELATKWVDDGKAVWISFYIKKIPSAKLLWGGLSLFNGDSEDLFIGCPWQTGVVGFVKGTTVADTLLNYILVKLEMNGIMTPDSAFMWVNYFRSTEPDKATAEEKRAWGTDGFTKIRIANDKIYSILYDKLRISNSFSANFVNIPVSGVKLTPATLILITGSSTLLKTTVIPENATDPGISFSSNLKSVADVNEKGLVTAVSPGKATITVKTKDGSKTATCLLTVFSDVDKITHDATVSDTDQQTVKGWGMCPIWMDNHDISTQPLTVKAAYNMGATMARLSQIADVGDADGNIIPSGADKLCRAIQITKDAGLPYIMSSWGPPIGMKTIAVRGSVSNGIKVRLREDKEQVFCNLVVNLFNYISITKKLPLPLVYGLQNEPTNENEWMGVIFTPEQYKRVTILLRKTLNAAGYANVPLFGGEDGGYNNGSTWNSSVALLGGPGFPYMNDADFNKAIGAFAAHSYDWNPNTTLASYNAYITGCDLWKKDRWQTEYCPMDEVNTPQAIAYTRRFIADMAFLKNNYWFIWTVNEGWGNTDGFDPCYGDGKNSLTKKPAYYVLKKLFTSIPVGAKVRRVTTDDKDLTSTNSGKMDMVAFVSDTNKVVVMVNPTPTLKTTNMNGISGASVRIYQMTSPKNNTDMEIIGSHEMVNSKLPDIQLPGNSVTIVVISDFPSKIDTKAVGKSKISIYPNPATNYFTVQNTSNEKIELITVSNLCGQTVQKSKATNVVNVSNLKSGNYIVRINTDATIHTIKLVKK